MTKRTQTKLARTLEDNLGNVSVLEAQPRQQIPVSIQFPNGEIKKYLVWAAPGQLINQIKLRKKIIDGKIPPSVVHVDN